MSRLTLTFDNGPEPGATERVLAALADRELRAIFFVVGQRLLEEAGKETARRVREAGHRIGNHTMTHGAPLGEGADRHRVQTEIGQAQQALADLGIRDLLFRPNGGGRVGPHLLSAAAVDFLVAGGYTVVTWNCVPGDWEPGDSWVARARAVISEREWTVLVLHDRYTVDYLSVFLDSVLADGIEVRNDFPTSCVPILEGEIQWTLEGVVANGTTSATRTPSQTRPG